MEISEFSFDAPLVQAYLITGSQDSGKTEFARKLAQAMVCDASSHRPCGHCRHCQKAAADIHPDIFTLTPPQGKKNYSVDQIRDLCADAAILPNEAERKVYLIPDADTLNPQSQNAFLKTLEEPPVYAAFLLIAENAARLLPTVLSRCTEIVLSPDLHEEEADPEALKLVKLCISQKTGELLEALFALDKMERQEFPPFCQTLRTACRIALRKYPAGADRIATLLSALDEAEQYFDANINIGTISGLMMAKLIPTTH